MEGAGKCSSFFSVWVGGGGGPFKFRKEGGASGPLSRDPGSARGGVLEWGVT